MDAPALPIDFATMAEVDPDREAHAQREADRLQEEQERKLDERRREAAVIAKARERYVRDHADDPYANPWAGAGWSAPA